MLFILHADVVNYLGIWWRSLELTLDSFNEIVLLLSLFVIPWSILVIGCHVQLVAKFKAVLDLLGSESHSF